MGKNKKDPNQSSGNDPRGRVQNQAQHQQDRYEAQQGPLANQMAYNYGRGSEANYGDYTDIMNNYRQIASGGGGGEGGGGGGGYAPSLIGYKDPFNSYAGFQDFSTTGGYSPADISNMRARGVSPIRAAYANANREVARQSSLQGGQSPNAIAARVKMAREQGQSMADTTTNVEAGLAEARNKGRLAGLTGMSDIEKQRLGADLDVAKFNAQAQMGSAASGAAASQQGVQDRLAALRGMTTLYGTDPAMSTAFGGQALNAVGQGGNMGLGLIGAQNQAQQVPGAYDTTMSRIQQGVNTGSQIANAFLKRNQKQPGYQPYTGTTADIFGGGQ